jgi:hypothetical protein
VINDAAMSAIPPKADIEERAPNVRFVPKDGVTPIAEKTNKHAACVLSKTTQMGYALPLSSLFMTHMHRQRPSAALGLPRMETPAQYREFAAECYRLASVAKTEEHRKILREMTRAWAKVAEEVES